MTMKRLTLIIVITAAAIGAVVVSPIVVGAENPADELQQRIDERIA